MSKSGSDSYKIKTQPRIPHALWYDEEKQSLVRVILPGDIEVVDNHRGGGGNSDDYELIYESGGVEFDMSQENHIELYDPEIHTDLLCPCTDCGGRVQRIARNDATGQSEHWKTKSYYTDEKDNRIKVKHKQGCAYAPIVSYDPSKPYNLEIDLSKYADPNSIETRFYAGAAARDKNNARHPKLKENFADLAGTQKIKIYKPKELVKLIQSGEFERIKNAFVTSDYGRFEEKDILVRYTRNRGMKEFRFLRLHDRLMQIPEGRHLPVFMEFQIEQGTAQRLRAVNTSVASHKIFMYETGDNGYGEKHFLVPRAVAIPQDSLHVRNAFANDKRFILAGLVKLGPVVENEGVVLHYIDMEVRDPEQIMPFDIDRYLPQYQLGLGLQLR